MLDHLIYGTNPRVAAPAAGAHPVTIAGRTCLAGDVFGEFRLDTPLAIGDEVRGSGVLVQALCPGITATEFLDVSETRADLKVRSLPMTTPRDVVEASLEGLDRGSRRVVVGLSNRVLGWVTRRLAPAALARRVAGELYRPRNKI